VRHAERLAFLNSCGEAGPRRLKNRVDCILLHPVICFKHFDIKSFRSCARADEFRQGLPLVIALS
jgi:hypothetical protein